MKRKAEKTEIRPGQLWQDCDGRYEEECGLPRRFRVEYVNERQDRVGCVIITGKPGTVGRATAIKMTRLRPPFYRLVKDVVI